MKKRNRFYVICCLLLFIVPAGKGQPASPFNGLKVNDSAEIHSFIVGGHFHGASTNRSTFPASTLLAGIDDINNTKASFLVSLGDLFLDMDEEYVNNYNRSFFSKLNMPLFNAVGNHDLSNGDFYERTYGETYYRFVWHSCLFVVLNTEMNDGSIKGEQLDFFKRSLTEAASDSIKTIFLFSHRPVWSETDPVYEGLFKGNTRTAFGENNYEEEIEPLLSEMAKVKPVYWMSGSMADGPASFFYHQEKDTKITFIQTAIRDLPRDAVLLVTLKNDDVLFTGISLTGHALKPVTNFDLDYWKNNSEKEEPFSLRLLPYLTMKMVKHYYFWIGFASSLVLLLLIKVLYNRWKRRG